MEFSILKDAQERPNLFHWAGPIQRNILEMWLQQNKWEVPQDLKLFWEMTGGGDFLESETIFAPFDALFSDDSVEARNRRQRAQGMPDGLLAFHYGFRFSVVDLATQTYRFADEKSYAPTAKFKSFDDWYVSGIRAEFQERYSLPRLSNKS